MEALTCPNCNAQLTGEIANGRTKCSYCGTVVIVETEKNNGNGAVEIKDVNKGITIATAVCPQGYTLRGVLNDALQSSVYPLTTFVCCDSADQNVQFFYESGKAFQQILKHLLLRHVEGQMETTYTIPMLTFRTVQEYVDLLAMELSQGKPINFEREISSLPVERVDDSIPRVVQVEMELQATRLSNGVEQKYGQSVTRLYRLEDRYLVLASTVFGLKWFVNAPMLMPDFGQMADLGKKLGQKLGKAFGLNTASQTTNEQVQANHVDPTSPGQIMRTPCKGKAVSITNWWVPAIYGMWSKEIPDEKTCVDFSMFCNSIRESDIVLQRRYEISEQYIRNMYVANQQEFARADAFCANAQQDIHRRQAQISQTLQQQSNIINSAYENRVAAQDRMRQKTSEAIRGVDTYVTSSGTTEFKTGAKRVIQKNNDPKSKVEIGYLDKVPDGWTEIYKQ